MGPPVPPTPALPACRLNCWLPGLAADAVLPAIAIPPPPPMDCNTSPWALSPLVWMEA
ncbi:hypothetical protein D3C85_744620 [compost metagenome]